MNKLFLISILLVLSSFAAAYGWEDLPEYEKRSIDQWKVSYQHRLVPILSNGLTIPIEVDTPEYTLSHPTEGVISVNRNGLTSVTRHQAILQSSTTQYNDTFQYKGRPTLVVSIPGWATQAPNQASGINDWQKELEENLQDIKNKQATGASVLTSQIKHFQVDWHSANSNRRQVKDLATMINRFLSSKKYQWDIVLVGHSRGGIFAHDLSKKLKGTAKINSLHTVLIDPTAAGAVNDVYPSRLHSSSQFNNYGSFIYDDKGFIATDFAGINLAIGAIGDRSILGYSTTKIGNSEHTEIPSDWLASNHFNNLISHVASIKDNTTDYQVDGAQTTEIIKIRVNQIYADLDIKMKDGNLVINSEVMMTPILSGFGNASVGLDGVFLGGGVTVGNLHYNFQTIINEDQIHLAQSNFIASGVVGISGKNGFYSDLDVIGVLGTDVSLNSEGLEINFVIKGQEIDIITTPSIPDIADALDDLGNTPGWSNLKDLASGKGWKIEGKVGGDAGKIIDKIGKVLGL